MFKIYGYDDYENHFDFIYVIQPDKTTNSRWTRLVLWLIECGYFKHVVESGDTMCINSLAPSAAYMCVGELDHHWFRKWLVAWTAPSHYPKQCWHIAITPQWTYFSEILFEILIFSFETMRLSGQDLYFRPEVYGAVSLKGHHYIIFSLHYMYINFDLCEKNTTWLCIHNYLACIHNYLACIHK